MKGKQKLLRVTGRLDLSRVPVTEGKVAVEMYEGNPGEIEFGASAREVRVIGRRL